jgi:hypothetical protein
LGGPADVFFQDKLSQLMPDDTHDSPAVIVAAIEQLTQLLDNLLGHRETDDGCRSSEGGALESVLAPFRQETAVRQSGEVRSWILKYVDDSACRIRGAQWLAKWLTTYCESLRERATELRTNVDQELLQVEQKLTAFKAQRVKSNSRNKVGQSGPSLYTLLQQLCRLRLYETVVGAVGAIIQAVKGQISLIEDEVLDLSRELRHLAEQFDTSRALDTPRSEDASSSDNVGRGIYDSVASILSEGAEELADRLNERLEREILVESQGLRNLLLKGGPSRSRLPARLRAAARATLTEMLRHVDVAEMLFTHDGQTEGEKDLLQESLEAATPRLLKCGGAKRLLVMLPEGSTCTRPLEVLHHQFKETPSVAANCDGDFVICYEIERMSLTQAAVTLIDGRRDFAEFAARLHTRTDVQWTNLPDLV